MQCCDVEEDTTHDPVLALPREHAMRTPDVVMLADPGPHVQPVHGPRGVRTPLPVQKDQLLLGANC